MVVSGVVVAEEAVLRATRFVIGHAVKRVPSNVETVGGAVVI